MSSQYEIGDAVPLTWAITVAGVATNATVVLTLTAPDGTTSTPAVSNPSTGNYTATVTPTLNGTYTARWVATGAVAAAETVTFIVGGGISLSEIKRLLDKSSTIVTDDAEIIDMLDKALAEYKAYVGPYAGTVTEKLDGGCDAVWLRGLPTTVTSVAYADGTVVAVSDLEYTSDSYRVGWKYGKAGYFTSGHRNVTVTYTTSLPDHHRDAIIADVAGYFEATQRRPGLPGEGYAAAFIATPMVSFPRIRALAVSVG